ncbi:MAG: SpoIIE family protein phosphatase [Myxococcota bacterium]|nr:SpoIIE family protein phosphatase [Myxococcota bacterium]
MKVLIAEDDDASRKIIETRLKKWGYEALAVSDGAKAWDVLEGDACPQMVLLDWEMPVYDGIELCRKVRALEGRKNLYIILLTGRSETDDVVAGLAAGADDYLTKPFNKAELEARLNVGRRTIDLRNQLVTQLEKVSEANQRLEKSLAAAAEVQKSLLPTSLAEVEGYDFDWRYLPSEFLGGDMLNLFRVGDSVICYVLDVSGHGVPSALLSVTVRNQIGQSGLGGGAIPLDQPAQVMNQLSRHFAGLLQRTHQYFTMLYGVLDLPTGEFRYVQAGHPFPVARSRGGVAELSGNSQLPLGITEVTYNEHSCVLQPGEELFLYTDGLTETFRPADREMFGEEGLIRSLEGTSSLDQVVAESLGWGETTVFDDDVTAIRISRLAP